MPINGMRKQRYLRNIVKLYSEAELPEIIEGYKWYQEAHDLAKAEADKAGVSLDTACQVLAILSPGTSWENNVKSFQNMLYAFFHGHDINWFNVTTYSEMKKKAWAVLHGLDALKPTKTNPKIYSFYKNILNPSGEDHVTIDRHAIRVLQGSVKTGAEGINLSQYRQAESVYKEAAQNFGLKPCQLQAVLWLVYKRVNNR